jgi:hypothetical protein
VHYVTPQVSSVWPDAVNEPQLTAWGQHSRLPSSQVVMSPTHGFNPGEVPPYVMDTTAEPVHRHQGPGGWGTSLLRTQAITARGILLLHQTLLLCKDAKNSSTLFLLESYNVPFPMCPLLLIYS